MNDNLLKISLNQGKQFNTYQTKIKKNITNTNKNAVYMFIMTLIHLRFDVQDRQQLV